jgi:hypothetical protein
VPWLLLVWAAGAGGEVSWSLALELHDGQSCVAGWVSSRSALPVWVVQGGAWLPGSNWGQLVALSAGTQGTTELFISIQTR